MLHAYDFAKVKKVNILTVRTKKQKEVVDITSLVNDNLVKSDFEKGICHLWATHTTCAITTADLDPGTDQDYLDAFEKLIPKLPYRHPHNPSHFPDHLLSSLIGTSLIVPVERSNIVLGQWQRVVLIEFDGPRERHINLTFIPEEKKQIL